MATTRVRRSQARDASGAVAELAALFRSLAQALFYPFRPELHYMRGPGPKWRAKHAALPLRPQPRLAPALMIPIRATR